MSGDSWLVGLRSDTAPSCTAPPVGCRFLLLGEMSWARMLAMMSGGVSRVNCAIQPGALHDHPIDELRGPTFYVRALGAGAGGVTHPDRPGHLLVAVGGGIAFRRPCEVHQSVRRAQACAVVRLGGRRPPCSHSWSKRSPSLKSASSAGSDSPPEVSGINPRPCFSEAELPITYSLSRNGTARRTSAQSPGAACQDATDVKRKQSGHQVRFRSPPIVDAFA